MAAPFFVPKESYTHNFAKELLFSWLKDVESQKEHCYFCGLAWNRCNAGIHTELKFHANNTPWYFEEGESTGKIIFVPDITIFHEGRALILIEIVHRSPVSTYKKDEIHIFFHPFGVQLYTIKAEHILNNTATPTFLNFKKIL